jgi:hypothetical protein
VALPTARSIHTTIIAVFAQKGGTSRVVEVEEVAVMEVEMEVAENKECESRI